MYDFYFLFEYSVIYFKPNNKILFDAVSNIVLMRLSFIKDAKFVIIVSKCG